MEIITRNDAYARSLKRYYTGRTCSRGHLAERYVTTGACVRCVNGRYKGERVNAYSKELMPWTPTRLWVPRGLTQEEERTLEKYLMQCIAHFARSCNKLTPELELACAQQVAKM